MNKKLKETKEYFGTNYSFNITIEVNGIDASINVEVEDMNKDKFLKLETASQILEDIARKQLTIESGSNVKLMVNQISTNDQWFGQFKIIK